MKAFIIRLAGNEFVTNCVIGSNYLDFIRTTDQEAATKLHDFDSQLVVKRLRILGEKPTRQEVPDVIP
jgi:hypothetical protein